MSPGRSARALLLLAALSAAAVLLVPAATVSATINFRGNPSLVPFDTDGDGKNDAVHVAQDINLTRNTTGVDVRLSAHLFPPNADPNRSWSGWVDAALDVRTIRCTSGSGCPWTLGMDLRSPAGGSTGNYTIVLNLTSTDPISGSNRSWTHVRLEPRTPIVSGASLEPSMVMVMGIGSVAVAGAAVWLLQRRPERLEIKTGKGYFVETFQRDQALRIVEPFVARGYATLVVSRVHPDEIHSMLPSPIVQPLWLVDYSDEAPKKVDAVPPSLEKLFARASTFLDGALRTAVVVDGLEFLIDNSNFSSVMRFLRRLIDIVAQRDSLVLVIVAPNALGPKERSNLERELTKVPG